MVLMNDEDDHTRLTIYETERMNTQGQEEVNVEAERIRTPKKK